MAHGMKSTDIANRTANCLKDLDYSISNMPVKSVKDALDFTETLKRDE